MAFNFELKMLIAPLGFAGSLKLQRLSEPLHAKRGSKQSSLGIGGVSQLGAPGELGASTRDKDARNGQGDDQGGEKDNPRGGVAKELHIS